MFKKKLKINEITITDQIRNLIDNVVEKEKNIQRDLHDGIVPYGGNLTVLDLVQKYIGQKKGVRHNTQANYDFVINIIKKEDEHCLFGLYRYNRSGIISTEEFMKKVFGA